MNIFLKVIAVIIILSSNYFQIYSQSFSLISIPQHSASYTISANCNVTISSSGGGTQQWQGSSIATNGLGGTPGQTAQSCADQTGLRLEMSGAGNSSGSGVWDNSISVTFTFPQGVKGPLTFNIYDFTEPIYNDGADNFAYYQDKITVSSTKCDGTAITPTLTANNGPITSSTVGSNLVLTAIQNQGQCQNQPISIGTASDLINVLTIVYSNQDLPNSIPAPVGSPPRYGLSQYQYVFIGNLTASPPDLITSITATPNTICEGESTTLTASSATAYTYTWSPSTTPASGSPVTATPSGTTTYTVTGAIGTCSQTNSVSVTVNPATTPTFTALGPYCIGDSPAILPGTSNNSYTGTWSPATISTAAPGTTVYTFTPTAGQCAISTNMSVTVNSAPVADAGISPGTITCSTTSLGLTGTGGGSYSWAASGGGNITTGANTATPTIDAGGTYTVTVTIGSCSASDNVVVAQDIAPPTADAGISPGIITCTTTALGLTGSGGGTYSWTASGGGNITAGATTATPTVNAAGTYTVTVTATNGCTASDNVIVGQDITPPTADAGTSPGNITCSTTTLGLTGTGGGTYNWTASGGGNITTGANTANPTIDAAGTYTVTVTAANGCTSSDNVVIAQDNTPPTADAGITPGTITCSTTSLNLAGSGGGTYSWTASGGGNITAGTNTATPTIDAGGTYTVTVTAANGCTASDNVIVLENTSTPDINVSGGTINCSTISINLFANGGGTYNWSASGGGNITSGANTATPAVDAAGTYTVTVTAANGCTTSANAIVTADLTTPVADAGVSPDTLDCSTTSLSLSASGGGTYSWAASGAGNITSGVNTATPTVNAGGTYTVTVTASNGCTASDNVVVVQDASLPSADAGLSPGTITCSSPSLNLSASGGGTYIWSASSGGNITAGANTATPTIDAGGTYTVTVTIGGCTSSDDIVIAEDLTPPVADAGTSPGIINCSVNSLNLSASGGGTYNWSASGDGNITAGAATATPTIDAGGIYTVTVTALNGCTSSDNIIVSEDITPPTADAGTAATLTCTITSLNLAATGGAIYNWSASGGGNISSGANTSNPAIDATGTYTVTVTAANGCTASDDVIVTADITIPAADAGNDQSICAGESATLTASGGNSYLWNTGAITASTTVNPALTSIYTVTVTGINGCTNTDNITITVNPLPTANAGIDQNICPGGTAVLMATGGGTYLWSNSAVTSSTNVSPATTTLYTVTVTSNGCTDTDYVTVTVNPSIVADAGPDQGICEGQTIVVIASGGGSYLWSTGDTTAMITDAPSTSVTYTVTVTNNSGCSATDEIAVTVYSIPTVTLTSNPDDFAYLGQVITFTAAPDGYSEYNFFVDTSLVQSSASNIYQSNTLTNGQIVSVTVGDNGCTSDTDTMIVNIKPIPNAFTPDGNGKNDVFAKGLDLTIINRWDQILYEGSNGWDGKYKNNYASPGTYYYIIRIPDLTNNITVLKGSVTLIDNQN